MLTERLALRRFTGSDTENLLSLDGDPLVMRFLTGTAKALAQIPDAVLAPLIGAHLRLPPFRGWSAWPSPAWARTRSSPRPWRSTSAHGGCWRRPGCGTRVPCTWTGQSRWTATSTATSSAGCSAATGWPPRARPDYFELRRPID